MEKIPYIVKKRMRLEGIRGRVNLPYGTEVEAVDGMIIHKGAAVCAVTSRNAHQYLARNDDGKGLERGALTMAITSTLEKRDKTAGIWCGRTKPAKNTGTPIMRTFSCGDTHFMRPRWRTCSTSRI